MHEVVEWLTPQELADRWKMSPRTLANWRVGRKGPAYIKPSCRVLYALSDVMEWESQNMRGVV